MASDFAWQLTEKAEADVEDIAIQLENSQAAAGFLNALQNAIQEACSFPESGALVVNDFLPQKTIRKKLVGNYIMYYFPNVKMETIYILRILYGRRNLDDILREMNLS